MVGRALEPRSIPSATAMPGAVVLEVEGLARDGAFADVRFEVRAGEVLGLGGLVGSGRTEIARVLFGVDRPTAGDDPARRRTRSPSRSPATPWRPASPMSRRTGIGQSLVMDFSDPRQRLAAGHRQGDHRRPVRPARELALVAAQLERLRLRFSSYRPAGQDAVRRQPAEGRAVEMAGDRSRAS